MNIFFIGSIFLSFFTSMCAMEPAQKQITWVTTSDNQLVEIKQQIAQQCALLTVLTEDGKNSKTNPLPLCVNKKDLNNFCRFRMTKVSTKDLYEYLQDEPYYALIDVADKLKSKTFYTELIDQVLPKDISARFIPAYIQDLYRNNIIKKNHTKKELLTSTCCNNIIHPKIVISDDGRYCMHNNVCTQKKVTLWNIKTNSLLQEFYSDYFFNGGVCFSPNGEYIIRRALNKTIFMNHIAKKKYYSLTIPSTIDNINNIIISSDSQHIMVSGTNYYDQATMLYAFWSLDTKNIPHAVADNSPEREKLLMLFDRENYHNDILSPTNLPRQSCNKMAHEIARLYIPSKKLFTHIAHNGCTLKLFGLDACLVASHTNQNGAAISALAVDSTGNHLASGYTDGTITLWDLSDITTRICGKNIITSKGTIKSLSFSDNQLLLSHIYKRYSSKLPAQPHSTTLWDIHGNEIIDFGAIAACAMSKDGNRIVTINEQCTMSKDYFCLPESIVSITAWNLHNEKTTKELNVIGETLTLSQALAFEKQYKDEQEKK